MARAVEPEAEQPRDDPGSAHPEGHPGESGTDLRVARGPLRWLLVGGGVFSLGLATIGVVLPLVPTTPFVLVAAACFARSSPRLDRWLRSSRLFGSVLEDWRRDRAISPRAKVAAVTGIVIFGGTSVVLFVGPWWLQLVVSAVLLAVMAWILTRPGPGSSPTPESR